MRITTWNCRRGPLAAKRAALEALDADIVVLSEAPRPSDAETDVLWFGDTKLGVAVIARPPFRLAPIARADVPCVYPVSVDGPEKFTLLAVWTWAAPSYREALMNGLLAYAHLPKPWVVAGDFNGNVCFDPPRRKLKWRDSFDRLEAAGLVSAYHTFSGAVLGKEPVATHYFLTHRDKPFHIDYCYIPGEWTARLENVRIAPFDEYASLSDHRPITVTIRTS
jgi:endonuclease/exonuclease/phosphatase family metal-dependent hydrolase